MTNAKKWKQLRTHIFLFALLFAVVAAALSYHLWGAKHALAAFLGAACLSAGLFLTEGLFGVFTKVYRANPTAIALLFTGKILWWAMFFMLPRWIPSAFLPAMAIGMGSFLLAILVAGILHYGMPKISDANTRDS